MSGSPTRLDLHGVDLRSWRWIRPTGLVSDGDQLLPMTMAKRGFSLGQSQVAWVGPAADDSPDGDLRIRTWGSDGVGGLRLQAPESDEVTPAS